MTDSFVHRLRRGAAARFALPAALVLLAMALLIPHATHAQDGPVGAVEKVRGDAVLIRQGSSTPAPLAEGTPVHEQDIIQTMENSRVKIRFEDDTVVSLGSDGILKITEFVYSPETGERRGRMTVPQGIFRTVMNAVVPDTTFEVTTATAVASVRGTDWITEATPEVTHAVCLEGEVAFRNADGQVDGEVAIAAGEGTSVEAGQSPDPIGVWGQARVQSFIDQTQVE